MSSGNGYAHKKQYCMHISEVVVNGLNIKNRVVELEDYHRIKRLNGSFQESENVNSLVIVGFKKCRNNNAKFAYLHRLLRHGCTDGILDILEHSTDDFNKIKNNVGTTFLHLAAGYQMSIVVEKLIDFGANIYVKNNKGATPLHFAVRQDDVASVILLLRHGANASAKDIYGYTPMDYAKAVKAMDCLEVLVKFIKNKKLTYNGFYWGSSVERTHMKRTQSLRKRPSVAIRNQWFDY